MEREQREKWDEREKEEKVEEEEEVEEDQRVRVTQCGTNKNRILLSLTDAHCKITHAVSQQYSVTTPWEASRHKDRTQKSMNTHKYYPKLLLYNPLLHKVLQAFDSNTPPRSVEWLYYKR